MNLSRSFDIARRMYVKFRMLTISDGMKKAKWLRCNKIFYHIGENCSYKSIYLPPEPFLVCLHDNVVIAADCKLITHSLTNAVFNRLKPKRNNRFYCQHGKIEIHSNVFVGANSIIMFNVTIGENCIVAAGSIVTKDVPPNSVVAGVPAKVIGSFEDSLKKAEKFSKQFVDLTKDETVASLIKVVQPVFDIDKKLR